MESKAAQRALEAAFDELDAAYRAVVQARGECRRGGFQGAPAAPQTIDRLTRLAPFSARPRTALGDDAGRHRKNLGVDHLDRQAAA